MHFPCSHIKPRLVPGFVNANGLTSEILKGSIFKLKYTLGEGHEKT